MLTYHPVTEEEKYIIADWKYTGEYTLYNTESYEEDLKKHTGFAHPEFLGYSFYDNETLTGFTTLSEEETEVMLGIGVTPELCSKGYGQEMIRITCEISEKIFPGKPLYLEVRLWNERAIHCYEKAGFQIAGEPFAQVTGLGPGIFVRMERKSTTHHLG
jgi:ribosomal protein S18 acetylase RimI-like enzyme